MVQYFCSFDHCSWPKNETVMDGKFCKCCFTTPITCSFVADKMFFLNEIRSRISRPERCHAYATIARPPGVTGVSIAAIKPSLASSRSCAENFPIAMASMARSKVVNVCDKFGSLYAERW